MKVLYIDTALDGHHIAYMKELIDCNQWESEIVLPDKTEELDIVQYTYQPTDMKNKTLRSFGLLTC